MISIHAPARGATYGLEERLDLINISIHAPARGATTGMEQKLSQYTDFNPRTREGCDTLLRICDLHQSPYFNPRTREGCDHLDLDDIEKTLEISIHAPARGATR